MLDAQEYLHLAIKSSQAGSHQAALEQLHHCLALEPDNAAANFLMAAEHAELGLFERAIDGMEKALSINPGLELASFQLAMLYFQNGEEHKAQALWDKLGNTTEDKSLQLFSTGLSLLCKNETEQAVAFLQHGIAENTANPAINQLIDNIVKYIDSLPEKHTNEQSESGDRFYLGAYSNSAIGDD